MHSGSRRIIEIILDTKYGELSTKLAFMMNVFLYIIHLDRSNLLLQEYRLKTADGCINHIIDQSDNHYLIPNYCINDPYFEKELIVDEAVEEKQLRIKLFEVSENIEVVLEVTNKTTGEELKKKFRKKTKVPLKEYGFRLFFAGNEIKNENCLYQYKVDNDYKIQVMKIKKSKKTRNNDEVVEKNINKNDNNVNTLNQETEAN